MESQATQNVPWNVSAAEVTGIIGLGSVYVLTNTYLNLTIRNYFHFLKDAACVYVCSVPSEGMSVHYHYIFFYFMDLYHSARV